MKLARRIRPGVTKAIDDKVNLLIKGLSRKSSKKVQDEAIEVGESLMRMIRTQSHKKELVHVVGIIALVFIIAGTAMLLPSSPLLLNSVILSSIGFGFGTARYLLYKGLLDSEGWKFSASNCIPKIFKRIYKACTEKKPKIEIKKGSYPSTIHLYHKRISNEERQRVNNEYLKLLARYTIPQS